MRTLSPTFTLPDSMTPDTTQPTNGTEKTSDIESSKGPSASNFSCEAGVSVLRNDSAGKYKLEQTLLKHHPH